MLRYRGWCSFLHHCKGQTSTTSSASPSTTNSASPTCTLTGLTYDVLDTSNQPDDDTFNVTLLNNDTAAYQFSGLTDNINFATDDYSNGILGNTTVYNTYEVGIVFHGYFLAPDTGTYTFGLPSGNQPLRNDDLVYIWLGVVAYTAWSEDNYDLMTVYTNGYVSLDVDFVAQTTTPFTLAWDNTGGYGSLLLAITVPNGTVYNDTTGFFLQPACSDESFSL